MQKNLPLIYLRERKVKEKVFINYLPFYFLGSCVMYYLTVFYFLPYILDISLLLSSIILGGEIGFIAILTIILFTKMLSGLVILIKNLNISMKDQLLHAKNTILFTYTRFS